jgi:hypothetical protein
MHTPALTEGATVACLPAEDVVVLSATTTWQVPWELMMRGPFSGCGLLDGSLIRHITVASMIASAVRRQPAPGALLEPEDYPVLPVLSSDMSLLDAAVHVVENGWDIAIVLGDEPRAISALSVYRALMHTSDHRSPLGAATGSAGAASPPVIIAAETTTAMTERRSVDVLLGDR